MRIIVSSLAVMALFSGLALAQPAKSPEPGKFNTPPKPAEPISAPDSTMARFGDWTLRCAVIATGKSCEMVQTLQIQLADGQQTAPFALLAIGRTAKGEPIKFVAQLPNNVTIANGVVVDAKPDKPLTGSFRRCLPSGCFADLVMPDDVRKRWQTRTENGNVLFHDGANKLITLPMSFRGFGAAMEALLKEVP